jgi:hypothetical protein
MKNTDVKEGDKVKLKRDYYIVMDQSEPPALRYPLRPHFIIEKDTVMTVKGKELYCHADPEEITYLQVTFTNYQGFKTGIWVLPEDVELVKQKCNGDEIANDQNSLFVLRLYGGVQGIYSSLKKAKKDGQLLLEKECTDEETIPLEFEIEEWKTDTLDDKDGLLNVMTFEKDE